MKDRHGIERGPCAVCLSEEIECYELTFRAPGYDELDFSMAFSAANPEDYKVDPVLACIRTKLDKGAVYGDNSFEYAEGEDIGVFGVCSTCGCKPEAHQVVELSVAEERNLTVLRRLYAPIDFQDCVAQSVRDTLSLGLTRDHFTYGEVGALSFLRLLDGLAECCQPRGVFYDLGCGIGRAVVLAALHSSGFSKCVGIELLPGLCAIARELGLRVNAETRTSGQDCISLVEFVNGDLFGLDIHDASLVLINIGSWEEPTLSRLRQHLLKFLPHRCKVITIRKQIAVAGSTELRPLDELRLPMSWGMAPVFVAERWCESLCPSNATPTQVGGSSLDSMD